MNRRKFVKAASVAGVGIGVSKPSSISFPNRASANDKLRFAVVGVNGRGRGLIQSFSQVENSEIAYVCDVDSRTFAKAMESLKEHQNTPAKAVGDFREVLDDDSVDAMVFAIPDHWQTKAALMAMDAGKHVYVEKPGSHNPAEGKLLLAGEKYYKKVLTLGTQQRSSPRTKEAVRKIREGLIGEVYTAKAFYTNTRGPIGYGKKVDVPKELDFEMWQGPAPRESYQDNLVHYNWHWFKNYGTGEACNNATHEVDICRWALGVEYPSRVVSAGGRNHYSDEWEFFDNQIMSFEFPDGKSITWEGRSCNGFQFYGRGRGTTVHGTNGTLIVDRDGYVFYDLENNEISRNVKGEQTDQLNTVGAGDLTDYHARNFADAIRKSTPLNQTIESGQKSVLLCHLGNIAQMTGDALHIDSATGMIKNNRVAQSWWGRDYEPGWEPKVG